MTISVESEVFDRIIRRTHEDNGLKYEGPNANTNVLKVMVPVNAPNESNESKGLLDWMNPKGLIGLKK